MADDDLFKPLSAKVLPKRLQREAEIRGQSEKQAQASANRSGLDTQKRNLKKRKGKK